MPVSDDQPRDLDQFVREARARPERTLLVLDVDGTVSPIAPAPDQATVDDAVRATLQRLAQRYRLWFISGRDADQARGIVGAEGASYIGAHGLEVLDERGLRPLFAGADPRPELQRLRGAVVSEVPEAARYVEQKRWSTAFHYRAAPEIGERLQRAIERHLPPSLRLRPGKMVLEVVPAVQYDKGSALAWLLASFAPRFVLVAGDDLTDIAMFRALSEERSRTGLQGLAVAVQQDAETPAEVVDAADAAVDGVSGLHALLRRLLEAR